RRRRSRRLTRGPDRRGGASRAAEVFSASHTGERTREGARKPWARGSEGIGEAQRKRAGEVHGTAGSGRQGDRQSEAAQPAPRPAGPAGGVEQGCGADAPDRREDAKEHRADTQDDPDEPGADAEHTTRESA